MDTKKAEHTVGDDIHVRLFYADDRACMSFYGKVEGARLHPGKMWPNQILYDVWLEQADAPHIRMSNLPKGFVLAGGPPVEAEEEVIEETA